jgi:two-component system sensor histidine kinase/response regulator
MVSMGKPVPVADQRSGASDTVARLREVPGLDVDAGLAFVGNSLDVYVRLLNRFVQLHQGDVHQLVQQAEAADHDSLQRLAHSIKGGAATLGLSGVAGLAKRLEEAACEGTPTAHLVELARALEAGHVALGRHLAAVSVAQPAERRT